MYGSGLDQTQQFGSAVNSSISMEPETAEWFCVRTHPKHEHIAAAQLRHETGIEVFLPRIRYKRSVRCRMVWVTEALFRDYLFARFDLATALRRVRHARSVREVVHFGNRYPTVPNLFINELRAAMGGREERSIEETLQSGDLVKLVGGPMQGLEAVVTRVMPARDRVAVLLEFLGRQTMVELNRTQLTLADPSPRAHLPVWEAVGETATAA